MVRNYKRKTTRQQWDESDMAVNGGMGVNTASTLRNVPRMSLKRRVKNKNKYAVSNKKTLGSFRPVFTEEQVLELVKHIIDMENIMDGLTTKHVRSLAFCLAEKNGVPHNFNKEECLAGKGWLSGFRHRHPEISLRTPESTSAARARAFNKPVVTKYFTILKEVFDKYSYPAHRIFNMDETSIGTVPLKNSKTFARRGQKQVGRVVSAERGVSSTAVICMSAGGNYVPPMIIFSRRRMKAELTDGAPPGTVFACNDSGWMKFDVFSVWFDHFLFHVKPAKEDPILLILDGHLSHTKNLEVIEKARANFVTLLCLPPHCTHKLQPLDVSLMFPLGQYYDNALEKWTRNHPGRVVTLYQISPIFGEAYLEATTPNNAINGFCKCGIFPYDADIFSDADFLPASTTDQPEQLEGGTTVQLLVTENQFLNEHDSISSKHIIPTATDIVEAGPSNSFKNVFEAASATTLCPGPSNSASAFSCPPDQIFPIPKMLGARNKLRVKRKSIGTTILTCSPHKNKLAEARKKEEDTAAKKNEKLSMNRKECEKMKKSAGKKKKSGKCATKNKVNKNVKMNDSKEDNGDNVNCFYCSEAYSLPIGGWIRCSGCLNWAHDECAGVEEKDDDFRCEFCQVEGARKRLDM